MEKISASIGILTLNSGKTLRACLESVKDFAEIIICDGNSTDDTLAIAREYGAKIIKQYESDEPNLSCVEDKDTVRQKNMEAATHDWYFFMDSDDTLSPEVMAEIRTIVANPNPEFLVYKMPTRIFIGEHEIKYWSFAPGYQIRFFNKKINPHFRGPVHDRIAFDEKKYPGGLLRNFYDYRWPEDRVTHYWRFLKKYVDREINVLGRILPQRNYPSFWNFFIVETLPSLKTAAGYLFWKIPRIYLRHGFKDSMPPKVEFYLTVWYGLTYSIRSIGTYRAWRLTR